MMKVWCVFHDAPVYDGGTELLAICIDRLTADRWIVKEKARCSYPFDLIVQPWEVENVATP